MNVRVKELELGLMTSLVVRIKAPGRCCLGVQGVV
jgi:hypothetical protein